MARYRESRTKVCRRLGVQLVRNSGVSKSLSRREILNTGRRPGKVSEFGVRLKEKQKIRFYYEISEKQLRNYYLEAQRLPGNSAIMLLTLLERRLDNAICQMRFATTMSDARQMVVHGHVTVNGKKCSSPAYQLNVGDIIGVRAKQSSQNRAKFALGQVRDHLTPEWIVVNEDELTGRVSRLPERPDVRCPVEEQKVIEFYSR